MIRRLNNASHQDHDDLQPVVSSEIDQLHDVVDTVPSGNHDYPHDDGLGSMDDSTGIGSLSSLESVDDEEERPRRKWVYPLIGVLVVGLLGLAGVAVYYGSQPKNQKIDNSSQVHNSSIGHGGSSSGGGDDSSKKADNESFMSKIGVPKYYQEPKEDVKAEDAKIAREDALVSVPVNAVAGLASSTSNPALTDDPSKAFNKDGTVNPDYSYLTMENTMPLIRDDMERIVNPVYGDWTAMQFPDRMLPNGDYPAVPWGSFSDMFVDSTDLSNETAVRRVLPLYADWNRNLYENSKFSMKDEESPIMGVINNYDCEFNVSGTESDTVTCVAHVTYSGKVFGKIESENSVLTLHYKVNYDTGSSSRRLLLTSVERQGA